MHSFPDLTFFNPHGFTGGPVIVSGVEVQKWKKGLGVIWG